MDYEFRELVRDITVLLIAISCIGNSIQIMELNGLDIRYLMKNLKTAIWRYIYKRLGLKPSSSGKAKKVK